MDKLNIQVGGFSGTATLSVKNPEIQDGFWSDATGAKKGIITEATYGEKVKFTVGTKDIPDGTVLNFTLFDSDINPDDELSGSFSATVNNNVAELEFTPDIKWEEKAKWEYDKVVEVYFKIEAVIKSKKLTPTNQDIKISAELPKKEEDYLTIYPKEVKITVLVELPHSHYKVIDGWKSIVNDLKNVEVPDPGLLASAKGLAGHTAMAIGDRYFDYGPRNVRGVYSEVDYDADFNKDGDKLDNVTLSSPSYMFAPGTPWWGSFVANKKGIKPKDVTLDMVLKFIKLHWLGNEQPPGSGNYPNSTNIYGAVHKVEFFVTEEQAKKMIDWWENRYNHPKIYSVFPWDGEQCTSTVKTALQEAGIYIPDETQRPDGILSDLKSFIFSTSVKHKGEKPDVKLLKAESHDWPLTP